MGAILKALLKFYDSKHKLQEFYFRAVTIYLLTTILEVSKITFLQLWGLSHCINFRKKYCDSN